MNGLAAHPARPRPLQRTSLLRLAPVLTVAAFAAPIACGVIGTLLLFAYAKIRPKKGSLTKEEE